MSLVIVGCGPGDPALLTPRAAAALAEATHLIGYGPYLERLPEQAGQHRYASANRVELDRARHALSLAAEYHRVAIVSAGDAGVFGMAAAVFEAIEAQPDWATIDVEVIPGVTAVLAAAARLGAPLGHDFCVLSLSDNLKPWQVIIARLLAAANAGFVIAIYNPVSRARPWQLGAAFEALRGVLPENTPVAFVSAVSRIDEVVSITTLAAALAEQADMRTLVMIGTAATRLIHRPGAAPWLYTPRSFA